MEELDWFGCYNDSLKGIISDEAFSHPAKFAYGLITRIYSHLLERGWLKEGDLVADPFAGVGIGGIVAAANGLRWIGVELEAENPDFVGLAKKSFALHEEQWEKMGKPRPVILQGDSRQFASIIIEAVTAIITSLPYIGIKETTTCDISEPAIPEQGWRGDQRRGRRGTKWQFTKQKSQGQLWADWGNSDGQLGNLPEGNHDGAIQGIVTSPPFERQSPAHDKPENYKGFEHVGSVRAGDTQYGYGDTQGQISQEQGDTYWAAVATVYQECFKVLKPNGVMAVVVKAFVRNKEIVDLPSQTLELLEAIGFEPLERVRAWMTSRATQKSLMPDIIPPYRKEKKSFFRRLYESKYPENRIDFEEVLIVRKP